MRPLGGWVSGALHLLEVDIFAYVRFHAFLFGLLVYSYLALFARGALTPKEWVAALVYVFAYPIAHYYLKEEVYKIKDYYYGEQCAQ